MINSKQRSKLRSLAHHLKPVINIGKSGIADGVIASIEEALESHELIKVKFIQNKELKHKFKPHGITLIVLLSESHLSMHTWPENKSICIDIFSCSDNLDVKKIEEILSQYFVINNIIIKLVDRTISKL